MFRIQPQVTTMIVNFVWIMVYLLKYFQEDIFKNNPNYMIGYKFFFISYVFNQYNKY